MQRETFLYPDTGSNKYPDREFATHFWRSRKGEPCVITTMKTHATHGLVGNTRLLRLYGGLVPYVTRTQSHVSSPAGLSLIKDVRK